LRLLFVCFKAVRQQNRSSAVLRGKDAASLREIGNIFGLSNEEAKLKENA
jgi:hypothetical protein